MKKFLIFAVLALASLMSSAETYWYKASSYAYRYTDSRGYWAEWTDWMRCNVNISFDLEDDIITIYSNKTQIYAVIDYNGKSSDGQGGEYVSYKVIDQDYDFGTIRLRIESNGNSQLYVDFANVMWVYNVRRTR